MTVAKEISQLRKKQKRREFLMAVPLILFTVLFIVGPMVYMVALSFMTRADTWGVVPEFTLKNYGDIGQPVYLRTFGESLKLAVISTVLIIALGYPFGYFMAKLGPKWKKRTMLLLMIPFWTSSLIRLYGWIIIFRAGGVLDSVLMALHITSEPLKVLYTYPAVVVGMVYALLPFMITSIYNSVEKLDWTVIEASRDLGASPFKAFCTVTVPLTVPGIVAGCVLVFVPSMGLFFISDLLGGSKTLLLGNLIKNEFMQARNWPMGATLSIAMLVFTTVFIYIYKRVTGAKTLGGLK